MKKKNYNTGDYHGMRTSTTQYGFTHGRFSVLQLLYYLDFCTVLRGGIVNVIYLDYAKEFDNVPHRLMLSKLEGYGVHGKILTWIERFLTVS